MKSTSVATLLGWILLIVVSWSGLAQTEPDVLVFYREGCNDCERMDRVLEELQAVYPQLSVRHIEESDPDGELMWALAAEYGIFPTKFPVIYAGDIAIVGIGLDKELRLRAAIEECMASECESPMRLVLGPRIPWRTILIASLIAVAVLLMILESAGT